MPLHATRRAALALALLPALAHAQTGWPTRPVRIIVPFPPGAGTDTLARAYAARLQDILGQPLVVENRAGGAGMLGTEMGARAAPDGYTMIMANASVLAINPAIRTSVPYDPVRSFDPIAIVGANDSALVVRADSPFRSVADVIAAARARPGALSYSSAGTGTSTHMAAEFLKQMAGVDILHVPYRGSPQAVTDMLGGQVDMTMNTINSIVAVVRDGRARALATTGATRDPTLPDVPTFAELGFTGYEASGWLGFVFPAGTPPPIIARMHEAIQRVGSNPEFQAMLLQGGMRPRMSTPEEFRAIIAPEIARWTEVARRANVQPE